MSDKIPRRDFLGKAAKFILGGTAIAVGADQLLRQSESLESQHTRSLEALLNSKSGAVRYYIENGLRFIRSIPNTSTPESNQEQIATEGESEQTVLLLSPMVPQSDGHQWEISVDQTPQSSPIISIKMHDRTGIVNPPEHEFSKIAEDISKQDSIFIRLRGQLKSQSYDHSSKEFQAILSGLFTSESRQKHFERIEISSTYFMNISADRTSDNSQPNYSLPKYAKRYLRFDFTLTLIPKKTLLKPEKEQRISVVIEKQADLSGEEKVTDYVFELNSQTSPGDPPGVNNILLSKDPQTPADPLDIYVNLVKNLVRFTEKSEGMSINLAVPDIRFRSLMKTTGRV